MRKSRDKKDSVYSQNALLKKFKDKLYNTSPKRASIDPEGIEMSDINRSKNSSELSARLLPIHRERSDSDPDSLTLEEVISKIYPEHTKYDEKKGKTVISWRHFDKSALEEIFGEHGKKMIRGNDVLPHLTGESRNFLEADPLKHMNSSSVQTNQLNFKKLEKFIDEQHPREEFIDDNNKRKRRKYGLCIPTGNYFFEHQENRLENYGLGITLYFKYVKFLIILFLVLFIVNFPAMLVFMLNRNSYPDNKPSDFLTNFLFKTTFGNIGGEEEVCGKASYIQGDTTEQRLYFECPSNMRIVDFFGFSFRNVSTCSIPEADLAYLLEDDYEDGCDQQIISKINIASQCNQKNNCTLRIDPKTIPEGCRAPSDIFPVDGNKYLVGYAICEEFYIDFPGLRRLEKTNVYYLLVVIDIVTIIIYSVGYFWVIKKEHDEEEIFKRNLLSPEQYTLKLAGMGKVQNIWQYINDLIDFIQEKCVELEDISIADVNFVTFDQEYLGIKNDIGYTLRKIHTLEVLVEKAKKEAIEAYIIKGLLEIHYRFDEKLKELYQQLEKMESSKPMKIKYIFLTFNKAEVSEEILRKFYEPATKRILGRFGIHSDTDEWRYFREKRLIVKRAPPSTNIRWSAISKSKFVHEFRKIGIFTVEAILIFFFFYWLMYLQIEQNAYLSVLGAAECPKIYDEGDVMKYWDDKLVLKCYCEQQFRGTIEEQLAASKNEYFSSSSYTCPAAVPNTDPYYYYQKNSACYDYFSAVEKFNHVDDWLSLQYGNKLYIAISNGLICLVSIIFAKMMRRPTISSELKESAKGAFLMQVLTLGWLALLSNIGSFQKVWAYFSPPDEYLFRIMCQDYNIRFEGYSLFTIDWFFTNGVGVIITFLMSSFTYHLGIICLHIAVRLYRWFDRGFTHDMRKTRKLIQSDYNKVYRGPVIALDNSYATILTFMFVIMMFATALPIMYLIAVMAFCILYWVDKYLQLRFYCNPPRFDDRFAVLIRKMIPVSILFHLAFGILIFGSYELTPPNKVNLLTRASEYVTSSTTGSEGFKQKANVFDLIKDILLFYKGSLNEPFVAVLAFFTVIVFFAVIIKMLFGDIFDAIRRNIDAYKGLYTRKLTAKLDMGFIEAIETHYIQEKLQLMEKILQNSFLPFDFEAKFKKIMKKYEDELRKRLTRQTHTKIHNYIKDMPFYSMELSEEYRKEFGFEYSRLLEYEKNQNKIRHDRISRIRDTDLQL